jgi:lipopolysaccharide assembly protein B
VEFEPWMLVLLPAFFAAGWFAARWDLRQTIRAAQKLPATYFQGIDHLLHDEQDQALAALIDVVKQDPDTPELHFALGALYRRRGETDRAIRVHENLLSRRDLSTEYRHRAQLEVGLDYVKAGLLKQAEASLNLLEGTPLAVKAEEQRIRLAQSERDWPLAIQMAKALRAAGHEHEARFEMHFHASMADEALSKNPTDLVAAKQALQQATILDSQHARVQLLQIKLARLSQDSATVRVHLEALAKQHPEFLGLAAVDWFALHGVIEEKNQIQISDPARAADALIYLQGLFDQHPSVDLACAVLRQRACSSDPNAFAAWASVAVKRTPSSRLLQLWLTGQNESASMLPALALATEQLSVLNAKAGRYSCKNCRFQARQHYWQCPGCGHWESYPALAD